MSQEEDIAMICPSCGASKLNITSVMYSVPYFNELAMFTMKCPKCGFQHNDVFSSEQRTPSRWTLVVDSEELLRVRVVRSGSGTVRLPEFGIDIEPGPAAESYISNVEGILYRTKTVVESAINFAETDEQKQKGTEIVSLIEKSLNGKYTFTLVIEDPAGVSGILPDDMRIVKREDLTPEESAQLKGAPMFIELFRNEVSEHKG
jgi:zinc finger protein